MSGTSTTTVPCIIGGLSAVIWTDFVQTIIMLFGGLYLAMAGPSILVNIVDVNTVFL